MGDTRECFFISPIGDEGSDHRERSNKVMEYIIKEAVSDYGYSVTRADQMDQPGSITSQVIQKTVDSELVIADLTGHNPNVFYELAVRHATGKPYIQLINSSEPIPFDISDLRTIKYGLEVDKADHAKDQIRGLLQSMEDGEPEFDNPISESAEMQSLRESPDPADQNLAEIRETMYMLDNKVDELQRDVLDSGAAEGRSNESTTISRNQELDDDERLVIDMISNIDKKHQSSPTKDFIFDMAARRGLERDQAEEILDNLIMKGHVYMPEEDVYRSIYD